MPRSARFGLAKVDHPLVPMSAPAATKMVGQARGRPSGAATAVTTADDNGLLPGPGATSERRQGSTAQTGERSDGITGGAIITIDLAVGERPIRLATLHQGFDDFTTNRTASGVDAAIESLRHVVDLVNAEIRHHLRATARTLPTAFTVVGVWLDDEPVPVGVIAGEHEVVNGDENAFEQGLWATSVTAPDPDTAQAHAVAEMRHNNH